MVPYHDWNSFSQSIPIKISEKRFFRLQAIVKVIKESDQSLARLWVRMHDANDEIIFFNDMSEQQPIQSNQWETYIIDGEIDETVKQLYFGGVCESNGTFYFSDFQLFIQIHEEEFEQISIKNPNFKNIKHQLSFPGWFQGTGRKQPIAVNNYSFQSENNKEINNFCLKIKGENIFNIHEYSKEVLSKTAYNMLFMLDDLTKRIIKTVQELTVVQIDSSKADFKNTIGALLIHITAIEAYFQRHTFENRKFNDIEEKQWQAAMDLTNEAQEKYKDYDINYYIETHLKVRENTIELFKKVDDQWFESIPMDAKLNNHYCWLHVIEHYGYHLGQITILKKNIS